MKPYYKDDFATIYHGSWRDVAWLCFAMNFGTVVSDPPYGIAYRSGAPRVEGNARSIANDNDTTERDDFLRWWHSPPYFGPALMFGSYKAPAPEGERMALVWDQGGALGMGDLALPWKPSWQLIHVIGRDWAGSRDCGAVYSHPPVQSVARVHPNEKPVGLLGALIDKCRPGPIYDPFMGSGSTLVAAKSRGRKCVGIELDERYCEIAAERCSQEVLDFGGVA